MLINASLHRPQARPAGLGQRRPAGLFAPLILLLPVLLLRMVLTLAVLPLLVAAFYFCLVKWLLQLSLQSRGGRLPKSTAAN